VRGVVEKTEGGYDKAQWALVEMRRTGILLYGWIADNTRWQRRPITYADFAEAIEEEVARFYRRSRATTPMSGPWVSRGMRFQGIRTGCLGQDRGATGHHRRPLDHHSHSESQAG
jgi:hypothetical protein